MNLYKTLDHTQRHCKNPWNELSQDPEPSLSEEIDHLLNQEYATSASLSELDMMLRNLESEDTPNREEETYANEDIWKLIDSI